MNRNIPGPGEMYKDREGKPYQILCVAEHFDTEEKMVVYQALYGAFEFLVRPLGIFVRNMERAQKATVPKEHNSIKAECREKTDSDSEKIQKEQKTFEPDQTLPADRQTEGGQADPALLEFLDADTLEEKYQVIKSMQHSITDRLIDNFAVTLDLVIPDGRLDDRYQELLSSMRTMQKFETARFRR